MYDTLERRKVERERDVNKTLRERKRGLVEFRCSSRRRRNRRTKLKVK